ncbi:MAG: hypothetical protein QXF55_04015 [Candidatus Aenigmatarchaeota archaeon]
MREYTEKEIEKDLSKSEPNWASMSDDERRREIAKVKALYRKHKFFKWTPKDLKKAEEERLARLTPEQRKAELEIKRRHEQWRKRIKDFEAKLSPKELELRKLAHTIMYFCVGMTVPGFGPVSCKHEHTIKEAVDIIVYFHKLVMPLIKKLLQDIKDPKEVRKLFCRDDIYHAEGLEKIIENFKRKEQLIYTGFRLALPRSWKVPETTEELLDAEKKLNEEICKRAMKKVAFFYDNLDNLDEIRIKRPEWVWPGPVPEFV